MLMNHIDLPLFSYHYTTLPELEEGLRWIHRWIFLIAEIIGESEDGDFRDPDTKIMNDLKFYYILLYELYSVQCNAIYYATIQ